jgi:glycosyltransferase involved in cell wall biosynthesis
VTKVSIVIPTWHRHELLLETIEHIYQQTHKNVEIIVVVDGQDKDLVQKLVNEYWIQYENNLDIEKYDVRLVELGKNWSSILPNSFGIAPLRVGYLMATGDYIMPWCDDERALVTDHIEKLASLLDKYSSADFVYPKVKIWRNGDPDGPETAIIGTPTPEYGQITHYMFRSDMLVKYGMPDWGTHPVDWSLAHKWMNNGAHWIHYDRCTFEHRLDQ